jgi:hypothetical protein
VSDIVLASSHQLPVFSIGNDALAQRDEALASAALIGKVANAEQNKLAVAAQKLLKGVSSDFEKARKKLKEPLLEAGRQLDRAVAQAVADVEKEEGRIANLISEFQLAEARRVREEEEAQRRELEKIERAKQEELKRIAAEQAEAERKARETTDAAQRQKLEAEAAERARIAQDEAIRRAAESAAAESKPITATRVEGQVMKKDWEIQVVNPYDLAKFHPDCVKIEPLMAPIKQKLNEGITVKGVTAKPILKAGVRGGSAPTIDV